jgi:hypothetical protein
MPRSSSSRSSSSRFHTSTKVPVAPYRPPYGTVAPSPAPSTGQTLKESLVSGVGSGIGFGVGSRIVSGLFGPPTVNVGTTAPPAATASIPSLPAHLPAFQQCQQNAIEPHEKPLCMKLFGMDESYAEFKHCMEGTGNQIHVCKEFLPTK